MDATAFTNRPVQPKAKRSCEGTMDGDLRAYGPTPDTAISTILANNLGVSPSNG